MYWIFALIIMAGQVNAAVNDIFPADYTALPAGTFVATGYFYDKSASGPYVAGKKAASWNGKVQNAVFRLSRYEEVADMPVAITAVMSYGHQALSGSGIPGTYNRSVSGAGDLGLHLTLWPISNPEQRHYLAINASWIAPTGQYRGSNFLNIGENRQRMALSAALIRGIGSQWTAEAIGEMAWYGTDDDYRPGNVNREQAHTEALTAYLRYNHGNAIESYVGYQWNRGGKSSLDDIEQHDPARSDRVMLGVIYPVAPRHIFNLRLASDRQMENGFAMREIALRWLTVF